MTLFEKVTLNHLDISFHLGWPIFRYPYRPDFIPAGDQHTSLPVGHGPSMGRNGPGVLGWQRLRENRYLDVVFGRKLGWIKW